MHDRKGNRVEIKNFGIELGNKFSAPGWRWDLSHRLQDIQEYYSDLLSDFDGILKNLLTFLKSLL